MHLNAKGKATLLENTIMATNLGKNFLNLKALTIKERDPEV